MSPRDITPHAPPTLGIPKRGATCSLSVIDTTCNLTVPSDTLVEPVIPGHELFNLPTVAFLITHSTSGKQLLYDLGCRKDFWKAPTPVVNTIDSFVPGIKVDRNLADVLVDGGIDLANLDAAIISHHHYDHIGNPSTFPPSMDLIVGPGFSKRFLPAYPANTASPLLEPDLLGRNLRELDFSSDLTVAGFRAHDYLGDGSLYILDTPGHAVAHLSALVRTTEDTFAFLGGDICHFGGSFRPTKYVPMPPTFSSSEVGQDGREDGPFDSSVFTCCHPDPVNARTSPYYRPCTRADSFYIDPPVAWRSIQNLMALDGDERVLVLIAHDPGLVGTVPFFPTGTLNDWQKSGWKRRLHWKFLNELPVEGKARELLVDGTYFDGELVKKLDGQRVE